jgi:acyl-CoA dehydrogenase
MSVGGSAALRWGDAQHTALSQHWLRSKGNSLEGGSSEIQLNIIAKRILGLPG